jgi:hypothetical protein
VVELAVHTVGFGIGAIEAVAKMLLDGIVGALAGAVVVAIAQLVRAIRARFRPAAA